MTHFLTGNSYLLLNKAGNVALEVQKGEHYDGSVVQGVVPNPQEINQLWMIQEIKNGEYQLIHAISCLVLEVDDKQTFIKKGKQKSSQLWRIQVLTISGTNYFVFRKQSKNSKKGLTLSKINVLEVNEVNLSDQSFYFRLQLVTNNYTLNRSCSLMNIHSEKYLDVPEASDKPGINIIQYAKNLRYNQRWIFVKMGGNYVIQSLKTKLNLEINGNKIIQNKNNGDISQRFIPEKLYNGNYVIRSMLDKKLVLGIDGNSKKNEAKIILCQYTEQCEWRIQGYINL